MAEIIRRIEDNDFQKVSALYNNRKSVEELRWLFKDPDNSIVYNAFVAINNNNQIIGVIGYASSTYKQGIIEVVGVIFMSWIISPDYKGFAGVTLLKKVLEQGDFGIALGGTTTAKNLYPVFKYKHLSNIDVYYKILNFRYFTNSHKRSNLTKRLGINAFLLPSYFKNSSHKSLYKDLNLIPYNGNNFVEEKEYDNIFNKKITKNYIDWLLDCPTLKTYAFSIKKGNDYLGICVLYIEKINNSCNRGRIVHLPFLGFDKKIWVSVIEKCLLFLKRERCCFVSGLAHNDMNHKGFTESGFIKIKNHHTPIYVKDNNHKLNSIDLDNWNMQYSEGDQAYRGL